MSIYCTKGFPEALAQVEQAHTATAKKELSEEMAAELNASLLSLHPGCQAIIRYHKTGHEQQITGVVTKNELQYPQAVYSCSLSIARQLMG